MHGTVPRARESGAAAVIALGLRFFRERPPTGDTVGVVAATPPSLDRGRSRSGAGRALAPRPSDPCVLPRGFGGEEHVS